MDEAAEAERRAEQECFRHVLHAYCEYGVLMAYEAVRRGRNLAALPPATRRRLPPGILNELQVFGEACKDNADFLAHVAVTQVMFPTKEVEDCFITLKDPRNVLAEDGSCLLRYLRELQVSLDGVVPAPEPSNYCVPVARKDVSPASAGRPAPTGSPVSPAPAGGPLNALPRLRSRPSNQRKVHQTLHSVAREWTAEGEAERQECFTPILDELRERLPPPAQAGSVCKVLVPGAGLGRLVSEIFGMGYHAQGNEFSYEMLVTADFMLNRLGDGHHVIHPWVDSATNTFSSRDVTRGMRVPDKAPNAFSPPPRATAPFDKGAAGDAEDRELPEEAFPPFSMTAGGFLEIYSEGQSSAWNAVTTCFFLDTAPRVTEYIDLIYDLLEPGGLWINLGPLLWHWAPTLPGLPNAALEENFDPRHTQSVELSYDQVRHYMLEVGFEMLQEQRREVGYTRNAASMMATVYNVAFFTARKPAAS